MRSECAWCGAVMREETGNGKTTHGICTPCVKRQLAADDGGLAEAYVDLRAAAVEVLRVDGQWTVASLSPPHGEALDAIAEAVDKLEAAEERAKEVLRG